MDVNWRWYMVKKICLIAKCMRRGDFVIRLQRTESSTLITRANVSPSALGEGSIYRESQRSLVTALFSYWIATDQRHTTLLLLVLLPPTYNMGAKAFLSYSVACPRHLSIIWPSTTGQPLEGRHNLQLPVFPKEENC
jgi:hypothetical protein